MSNINCVKVAYVLQNVALDLSEDEGTQIHVRGVLKGLQETVNDVTLVTLRGREVLVTHSPVDFDRDASQGSVVKAELRITGAPLFKAIESATRRFQAELRLPYFAFWDSLRLCEGVSHKPAEYGIIHAHFDFVPLGAALASRRLKIPLVLDCEGDWFDELRQDGVYVNPIQARWARWSQRFCFDTALAIVCVSEELRQHLIEVWQIPRSKLHVLANGVDVETFSNGSADIWREKLGVSSEPIVVFVGGFYKRHALDQLVESFALVLESVPACQLVMVGDGRELDAIRTRVQALGVSDAVKWTGEVDHKSVPGLLAMADVAVCPALESASDRRTVPLKTSPLKLFEYMGAGKACVATATGQVKDVITHQETGLLVRPGDVEGFAKAIVRLLLDAEERRRLGKNAQQQVVERHSWRQYGSELARVYTKALSI